jgi:AAA ATPase domain
MERLDSFVAGALLERLRRADHDDTATCASFRGAVLFVDISGYTALAEALCSEGANGIEQLGETLDRAFRGHVRAVHGTGGEIACFAGDAFIAYWPADDGNVPRALRRADDCARLLNAASRVDTLHAAKPQPALHIGVSAGEMWAARLGTADCWQLLLAGPAVRQACAASARAAAGTTVVASDAGPFMAPSLDPVTDFATITRAQGGSSTARRIDGMAKVPKRVQDYDGEGYETWIPQRRTIWAVFIRINGLDDQIPEALARHQAAITSLHVALRPYTGSSGTLLLDDKGLVLTLCLGMPHDAHADDALRAVRAGLAVRSELARLGLSCAIGIAGGPGVCMPLGGPQRRHYWAVGRFMHVAGRLMEAAGDGPLCTEEVAARVRRSVSLSPERPLVLKGLRWPLRPFRIREAEAIDDHFEVLYGREDEQATLDEYLHAFEGGRGTVLWLVGDAGLGKTALIHYLRHAAAQRQITCWLGAAGSVEIAAPYAAWRPVFATLLKDAKSSDYSPQSERRARLGSIRHEQLAPLINAVIPGYLDETPLVRSLSGQARADATLSVLSEVIGAQANTGFVLVLEDCHWMDSASWRLVVRVAQDYPRALIVLTSRPGADVQELSGLRRLQQFADMKLAPLRPAAIAALVEGVLGGGVGNQEVVDEITQRSVGHPLFAREYALLRATHLTQGDIESRPTASPVDTERVPVTIHSLIASRLDALSPSEDLALKAASVIGDSFGLDLIASVYPGHTRSEALDSILVRLAGHQLIVRASTDDQSFAFQHAIIREVTYQQLTREQRSILHRRVAEALEREYGDDLRSYFGALAHHWSRAEVPASTIKYADLAASQALAAGAFEEAERLLGSCIELASSSDISIDVGRRIRWHRQMADARHGMGQLEPRSAAAHQVLRLAGLQRAHHSVGLVAQAGARLCRIGLRRVRTTASPRADSAQMLDVARAFRHSAEVCYFNNDMLGMICDSVSAVACASALPPSAVLAGASTELGGILSVAGPRRAGESILQRAIAMAEAADDQAAQAYAHMISCLYYVGRGEWGSAEASAQRCQDLCEPMDDRVNWTNAQTVRFWMSHYRSHHAAAYDAACRLRDRANQTGNRQHRAWALRCLAVCSLRRDDPNDAVIHLQAAIECLGETAALNERIPTLGLLALAQLRNRQVWAARATAKEALAQIVRVKRPIGHGTLEGYSALITVALDAWGGERSLEWRRAVRHCLRVLRRYRKSFPVGEPRYQLHLGDYHRLSGSIGAARRSYLRGEAAASRLGMPWDARQCRDTLAATAGA